ncbi:hypothetical protein DFJ74DRAFT_648663 [Hyaloraphidium curvatum]|nr:hypothetical protein DFJ74DRAFT_648663 [Hyaloraphidium curvatum]
MGVDPADCRSPVRRGAQVPPFARLHQGTPRLLPDQGHARPRDRPRGGRNRLRAARRNARGRSPTALPRAGGTGRKGQAPFRGFDPGGPELPAARLPVRSDFRIGPRQAADVGAARQGSRNHGQARAAGRRRPRHAHWGDKQDLRDSPKGRRRGARGAAKDLQEHSRPRAQAQVRPTDRRRAGKAQVRPQRRYDRGFGRGGRSRGLLRERGR